MGKHDETLTSSEPLFKARPNLAGNQESWGSCLGRRQVWGSALGGSPPHPRHASPAAGSLSQGSFPETRGTRWFLLSSKVVLFPSRRGVGSRAAGPRGDLVVFVSVKGAAQHLQLQPLSRRREATGAKWGPASGARSPRDRRSLWPGEASSTPAGPVWGAGTQGTPEPGRTRGSRHITLGTGAPARRPTWPG